MALKVCRICGGNEELKSILDEGPEMVEKLLKCADIQVFREDSLPKFICQQCDQHLDLSYKLRQKSKETAQRLKIELNIENKPTVVEQPTRELKAETATSSTSYKEEIKVNLPYTSAPFKIQMSIKTSAESSNNNAYKQENKPIHFPLKIEPSDIDEEEFQAIVNNNPELEEYPNDADEVYGSLESRPPSITPAQYDIKIEEVKLIPPDKISMDDNDCNDAEGSLNHLQMQQNSSNDMFIEDDNKAYINSNHSTNAGTSTSESASFVDNSNDMSTSSDSATEDCEDRNLKIANSIPKKSKKCTCNICKQKFTQLDDLKGHMKLHSNEYRFICTICFHGFKRHDYLDDHDIKHHPGSKIHQQDCTTHQWTTDINIPEKNQCYYCGKQLKSSAAYKNHIQSVHPNEKPPHQCKTCNKEYLTLKSLTRHESLIHSGNDTPHKCEICLKSFKQLSHLRRHKVLHSDLPPQHSCSICLSKFRQKSNLDAHMRIHTKEKKIKCKTCNKKFTSRDELTQHESQQHYDNNGAHQCDICLKNFKQLSHLRRHKVLHSDLSPQHSCSICPSKFRQKSNLDTHMRTHTKEKPFMCKTCNKTFTARYSLTQHESQHHSDNIRPHKCDICLKSFKLLPALTRHRELHSLLPPQHSCSLCSAKFRRKDNLDVHMRIHTKEKKFKCNTCNKKFYTRCKLTLHVSQQHSDNKPYKCDNCLKSFKQLSHLTRHKLLHSDRPPKHSCSICSAQFRQKGNLDAHLRIHTKEKPFKCVMCSKNFAHSNSLKVHTKKFHSEINPLEKDDFKLHTKDDRLEYDFVATSEYESHMCIDFPEEIQQQLPSTSKTKFRNAECFISPQNIVNENSKALSFLLPMEYILKDASKSSTSTTESNLIDIIKVEEYQIMEQNVEEVKTDNPKFNSIYNIADLI